jgi:hypothetical protein
VISSCSMQIDRHFEALRRTSASFHCERAKTATDLLPPQFLSWLVITVSNSWNIKLIYFSGGGVLWLRSSIVFVNRFRRMLKYYFRSGHNRVLRIHSQWMTPIIFSFDSVYQCTRGSVFTWRCTKYCDFFHKQFLVIIF